MPVQNNLCAMCNSTTDGHAWVGLNRFIVGTLEGGHQMAEARDLLNDAYRWDVPNTSASIVRLCWPECATMYLEGKLIETACDKPRE